MADEKPLDSQVDPEQAALDAELERLKRGEATETTAVAAEAQPEAEAKPAEEAAPAATEPTAEAKPTEEVKPAVEAKPAEPAKPEVDPEKAREGTLRRLLRNQERELAELRREKAAREQQSKPAEEVKPPSYNDDPAEYLKSRVEQQDAEINRLKAQNERDKTLDEIRRGEQDILREHPDYFKASDHLINSEVQEWDKSGMAAADVRKIMANPQTRGFVENMAANPQFQDMAEKEGRDPLDAAAWVVARDTHLLNRQQQLIEAARATGRSVAQIAYEIAGQRGYKIAEVKPAAAVAEQAARDRVAHSRELSDAARSLSESPSAEGTAQPKVIRNRNQVLTLTDDELDAMIQNGSYKNL